MLAFERKSKIIEYLEHKGKAEVSELANLLSVVPETIRRDFRDLEKQGVLTRTHGGALIKNPPNTDYPVHIRIMKHNSEKELICRHAAQFVGNGDVIFVDNSTTLINFIKYINDAISVTVVTNSLQLIQEFANLHKENVTMICSGGVFNKQNMSLSGEIAGKHTIDIFPNKAFVSCHGVSAEFGLSDGNFFEVGFKREMINISSQVFFLVDHTKFDKLGPIRLGNLKICDVLITDQAPSDEFLVQLKQANPKLELIIA